MYYMLMYFVISPPLFSLDACISYSPMDLLARFVRAHSLSGTYGIAAIRILTRETVLKSDWDKSHSYSVSTWYAQVNEWM